MILLLLFRTNYLDKLNNKPRFVQTGAKRGSLSDFLDIAPPSHMGENQKNTFNILNDGAEGT